VYYLDIKTLYMIVVATCFIFQVLAEL